MRYDHTKATNRLLHDLAAVGRMQTERPSATERVEALLGAELAGVLRATLADTSTPTGGLQPRRAA
jgi:hypothetical protein